MIHIHVWSIQEVFTKKASDCLVYTLVPLHARGDFGDLAHLEVAMAEASMQATDYEYTEEDLKLLTIKEVEPRVPFGTAFTTISALTLRWMCSLRNFKRWDDQDLAIAWPETVQGLKIPASCLPAETLVSKKRVAPASAEPPTKKRKVTFGASATRVYAKDPKYTQAKSTTYRRIKTHKRTLATVQA